MHSLATLAGDTAGYRLLLIGHLLCVIVGFGSTFVWPFLGRRAGELRGKEGAAVSQATNDIAHIVTTPFIYAAGVFGLLLVMLGPSDFDAKWIQVSITLYAAAILFSAFVHVPNLSKLNALSQEMANAGPPAAGATGPPPQAIEAEKRAKAAARNGGLLHLAFAVILVLMVWRPA